MINPISAVDEWHICFTDVDINKHWVQNFFKPGFYHCYAFKESAGGQFLLIIDPSQSHINVDMVPKNAENLAKLTDCHKVLKVVVKYELLRDRGHLCRFNCVEVIKALLGLKSFLTFTPYQLYKRIINHGL